MIFVTSKSIATATMFPGSVISKAPYFDVLKKEQHFGVVVGATTDYLAISSQISDPN